jgi:hypothetical protein
MPPVVIAAAITAGASTAAAVYGAHEQGAAEDEQLAAQQKADAAKLAEQQREFDAKQAADQQALQEAAARKAALVERLSPWTNAGGMALSDLRTKMGLTAPPVQGRDAGVRPPTPASPPRVRAALAQAMSLAQLNGQQPTAPTSSPAQPPSGTMPSTTQQPGYVPVSDTQGQVRYVPPTDAEYWFAQLGTGGA